eukprot:gnl/Dysnectes_brevis/3860_a4983_973.p1 GENE.gnl/Dysnectes_brevis/3860_a4983_973~~gnl/Dysnectes_brevis/3860_a4983_973.p1  ORF type:complete len:1033 (+),score=77.15 gnl/Dysnectes_brevis/3860_a4983_973:49-3099(+)
MLPSTSTDLGGSKRIPRERRDRSRSRSKSRPRIHTVLRLPGPPPSTSHGTDESDSGSSEYGAFNHPDIGDPLLTSLVAKKFNIPIMEASKIVSFVQTTDLAQTPLPPPRLIEQDAEHSSEDESSMHSTLHQHHTLPALPSFHLGLTDHLGPPAALKGPDLGDVSDSGVSTYMLGDTTVQKNREMKEVVQDHAAKLRWARKAARSESGTLMLKALQEAASPSKLGLWPLAILLALTVAGLVLVVNTAHSLAFSNSMDSIVYDYIDPEHIWIACLQGILSSLPTLNLLILYQHRSQFFALLAVCFVVFQVAFNLVINLVSSTATNSSLTFQTVLAIGNFSIPFLIIPILVKLKDSSDPLTFMRSRMFSSVLMRPARGRTLFLYWILVFCFTVVQIGFIADFGASVNSVLWLFIIPLILSSLLITMTIKGDAHASIIALSFLGIAQMLWGTYAFPLIGESRSLQARYFASKFWRRTITVVDHLDIISARCLFLVLELVIRWMLDGVMAALGSLHLSPIVLAFNELLWALNDGMFTYVALQDSMFMFACCCVVSFIRSVIITRPFIQLAAERSVRKSRRNNATRNHSSWIVEMLHRYAPDQQQATRLERRPEIQHTRLAWQSMRRAGFFWPSVPYTPYKYRCSWQVKAFDEHQMDWAQDDSFNSTLDKHQIEWEGPYCHVQKPTKFVNGRQYAIGDHLNTIDLPAIGRDHLPILSTASVTQHLPGPAKPLTHWPYERDLKHVQKEPAIQAPFMFIDTAPFAFTPVSDDTVERQATVDSQYNGLFFAQSTSISQVRAILLTGYGPNPHPLPPGIHNPATGLRGCRGSDEDEEDGVNITSASHTTVESLKPRVARFMRGLVNIPPDTEVSSAWGVDNVALLPLKQARTSPPLLARLAVQSAARTASTLAMGCLIPFVRLVHVGGSVLPSLVQLIILSMEAQQLVRGREAFFSRTRDFCRVRLGVDLKLTVRQQWCLILGRMITWRGIVTISIHLIAFSLYVGLYVFRVSEPYVFYSSEIPYY